MLKNKETGNIVTGYVRVGVQNDEKFPNPIGYYTYNSIAELKEEWEDYKPTEPLIKDEEIISLISLLERIDRKLSKLCGEEEE